MNPEQDRSVPAPRPQRAQPVRCSDCASRPLCLMDTVPMPLLEQLQSAIRQRRFRKGEVLAREDEQGRTIAIVKAGSVFAQRKGLDGAERLVGLWSRGGVFSLCAFMGQPTQLGVVAASDGVACEIQVEPLRAAAQRCPPLQDRLARTVAHSFGLTAAWSELMRLPGVSNQLAYALLLLAREQQSTMVELPNQKWMAALLGTTRESIARATGALESAGLIRRRDRGVYEFAPERILEQLRSVAPSLPLLAREAAPPHDAAQAADAE